uniref:Olfactory receptor n=1 Tax=Pelusios castaneus TaxID=367368 RepID=A0A8C8VFG0_9SAUR
MGVASWREELAAGPGHLLQGPLAGGREFSPPGKMAEGNHTTVTDFILLGFTEDPETQEIFFVVFLVIYLTNVGGNLGMIFIITIDSQLHTPMYFFLWNLSFCDFCYSSAIAPKMLVGFLHGRQSISFAGCTVQFFLFGVFMNTGLYTMAAMAYDRYVAICNPLLYSTIMSGKVCVQLVVASYFASAVNIMIHTGATVPLCSNTINHFFCDIPPILKLSCSSTDLNELVLFVLGVLAGLGTLTFILISYFYIVSSILKIHSAEGKHKAFSTCTSHLMAITLFYGAMIFAYLRPTSSYYLDQDKLASLSYTVVIPMLNPLIYSLRNKEVKDLGEIFQTFLLTKT